MRSRWGGPAPCPRGQGEMGASSLTSSILPERSVIRPATTIDCAAMTRIYNHYVWNTIVTFEEEPVTSNEMTTRLRNASSTDMPWLAVDYDGRLVGYACASRWEGRRAYRFAAETAVYLDPTYRRRGLGSKLYARLLSLLRRDGFHVAIGGIALPNNASVALHEKFGLRKVAHFPHVGFKFKRWIDVGYWELVL
jgi:L-amino acid N-acyltransferase YncA